MELKELECTIEGILFAAGDPVPVERMAATLEQDVETVDSVCRKLADEYRYQRRGICLVRTEHSWQMCTAPEYADPIRKTLEHRKPPKLSQTALENGSHDNFLNHFRFDPGSFNGAFDNYGAELPRRNVLQAASKASDSCSCGSYDNNFSHSCVSSFNFFA